MAHLSGILKRYPLLLTSQGIVPLANLHHASLPNKNMSEAKPTRQLPTAHSQPLPAQQTPCSTIQPQENTSLSLIPVRQQLTPEENERICKAFIRLLHAPLVIAPGGKKNA
jgi:hypothetical protein